MFSDNLSPNVNATRESVSEEWEKRGWGLADPEQEKALAILLPEVRDSEERRQIALDHLRKSLRRAERFAKALDQKVRVPLRTKLILFAGDAEETPQTISIGPEKKHQIIEMGPGDGTVLRTSTLLDERMDGEWSPTLRTPIHFDRVNFVFKDHIGMTTDPFFADNVLYILLDEPDEEK